jgi:hypothetical protein
MIKGFIITAISEKGEKYIKRKIIIPAPVKAYFNRIVLNKDPLTVAIDFKISPFNKDVIKFGKRIVPLTPEIKKEIKDTTQKHMCIILNEINQMNWSKGVDYAIEVLKDE